VPQELARELERVIETAADDLRRLPVIDVAMPRSPGAWSKQEILGHLIDSAANNHQRFVRAQQHDELRFPPYDQNAWVQCQHYDDSDWDRLVDLWLAYNRHLVHVVVGIPRDRMETPCWVDWFEVLRAIPLRSVVEEYIGHMRHHLEQIRE